MYQCPLIPRERTGRKFTFYRTRFLFFLLFFLMPEVKTHTRLFHSTSDHWRQNWNTENIKLNFIACLISSLRRKCSSSPVARGVEKERPLWIKHERLATLTSRSQDLIFFKHSIVDDLEGKFNAGPRKKKKTKYKKFRQICALHGPRRFSQRGQSKMDLAASRSSSEAWCVG
jgi:hypothetical protein